MLPPPHKYQLDAVDFVMRRFATDKGAYLAMEQGLGKTRTAAMIAEKLNAWCCYVSPPALLENVGREFALWAPKVSVLAISDGLLAQATMRARIGVHVKRARRSKQKTLLIIDEAHRYAHEDSQRSMALHQAYVPASDYVLYMSGTPMPNGRPIELWPMVKWQPEFALVPIAVYWQRYCGAYFDHDRQAWNFNGASNTDEFFDRIQRTFMLRLTKQAVLPELPLKTIQTVYLPAKPPEVEEKVLRGLTPENYADSYRDENAAVATVRCEVGLAKVKLALDFIKTTLTASESVIVFAYHTQVIAELAKGLAEHHPGVITGATPTAERQALVDSFQAGFTPVLVANYIAGGVGFNITTATRVVFVEFSWTPGENQQAEDRAHRLGQKDNVLIQYLCFPGSIDEAMLKVLARKQGVIEKL